MVRKAAKIAVGIAVGTAIGGCILPRLIFPELYSGTWPPIWKEAILYLATGFIAAFSVLLLIYRIKAALTEGKQPLRGNAQRKGERRIFTSELPENIDWDEVGAFLRATQFYKHLLLNDWQKADVFNAYPLSDTSMDCLRCLHEDLTSCYQGIFAFDENGEEDRHEEYRLLRENLYAKYGKMDADMVELIYLHYLQEDR